MKDQYTMAAGILRPLFRRQGDHAFYSCVIPAVVKDWRRRSRRSALRINILDGVDVPETLAARGRPEPIGGPQ